MTAKPYTVLVLCTGNSCRSQMAEVLLNHDLAGQVRALSAGTRPQPKVADGAIAALKQAGLATVPVTVRDVDDEHLLELALVENIQREQLNPVEEAQAYQRLLEVLHLTQGSPVTKDLRRERVAIPVRLTGHECQMPTTRRGVHHTVLCGSRCACCGQRHDDRENREATRRSDTVQQLFSHHPPPARSVWR